MGNAFPELADGRAGAQGGPFAVPTVRGEPFIEPTHFNDGKEISPITMPGQPDPTTIDAEGDRIQQPLQRTHAFSAAVMNLDVDGYGSLARVLRLAFEQSAEGKGRVRHANAKPFLRQPILENGRMFGDGFTSGQAVKKLQELHGMIQRGEFSAAKAEALGSIVYAAATYLLIEEKEEEASG